MEILESRENPLLKRREVKFKIVNAGATPSRKEVKRALCAKLGVGEGRVVIAKLDQGYGRAVTVGTANVYNDEESAKIEREHLRRRDAGEKGKPKEQKPKEEKKEAPKEEAKPKK